MTNCSANTPRGHQFAIAEYGTAAAAAFTRRLPANRFALKGITNTVQDEGIQQDLWEYLGDEVLSTEAVSGQWTMNPRPADLQALVMCIFGDGAFSSDIKLPGNICNYFQAGHSDPVLDKIFRYNNCVTPSAVFSASDQSPLLQLAWNIEAQSRTITADVGLNWPSLTLSTQQPFVFRQGTLTVDGNTYKMKDFSFEVNNNLQLQDFFNSLNREEMPSSGQTFTLTHTSPWDDANSESDMIGTLQEDISASLSFVSGTKELTFDFPALVAVVDEPEVAGRNRIMNQFSWKAKYDSGDAIAAPVKITAVTA